MRIAITGASGQFGLQVSRKLLDQASPHDLTLISRTPERLGEFESFGCQIRYGDFDDSASLIAAFSGADKLLLISGTRVGQRLPQHANAINAAKTAGVQHVIYTSFLAADKPANKSEAVKDHRGTEEMLRKSGLSWTALRNAQYADAVTDVMAYTMVKDGVMLSVAGEGQMPFVWRDDCVDAAIAALTGEGHENKGYAITGPDLVSYREVAALIAEFTGQPVDVQLTDEGNLYAAFDALGIPREPVDNFDGAMPWNSNDMVSFEVAVRDGHFAVVSNDFEMLTGRKPRSLRALFEMRADRIMQTSAGKASNYTDQERRNIALVRRVYDDVLGPLDASAVRKFFAADYIQHSPMAETSAKGLEEFLAWAKGVSPGAKHYVKRMFADGDHVIAHVHVVIEPATRGNAVIDIFRIANGRIAEHWDAVQAVPEHSQNSNGIF